MYLVGEPDEVVEHPASPVHPDLPARVSVLMLPARGLVARLLEPRDLSAVDGSGGTGCRFRALRPVRCSGLRWSVMLGTP